MKLKELPIVVFDTETTGLSEDAYIVELGAVKLLNGRLINTFSQMVRPPIPIPQEVVRIHGITDDMVSNAPCFAEVAHRFLNFIKDALLVAHNAPFDMKILASNIIRAGLELPDNPVIDTCKAAKRLFPDLPSHSLKFLAKYWKSPYKGFHNALSDAKHTAYVFYSVLEKCGINGESSIDELMQIMGPPLFFSQFRGIIIPSEPRSIYEIAIRAIEMGCSLEVRYENGRELKSRVVPLNLFTRYNRWYLRAICLISDREKIFRIDRIKEARIV